MAHIPTFSFTAKEVHILIQALRIAVEDGNIDVYAKPSEIEKLRNKLNEGGVK